MLLPNPHDAIHKAWLYRLLSEIYDQPELAVRLYFKGGTCAAMLGFLDRFSVDLDFDYVGKRRELNTMRGHLTRIFSNLGLEIKNTSKKTLQYFLRYPAPPGQRNTIKIDVTFPPPQANKYRPVQLPDIDRVITCQTKETMFGNKLVALIERHEKHEAIAGRDLYDIHHFFLQGFPYNRAVILERRHIDDPANFFKQLIAFIETKITQTVIDQDLNVLLPPATFKRLRHHLKQETLAFLHDELARGKN